MSKHKGDKWLDELISRTINTTKPEFDSKKWKQKYPKEFQMLISRAGKTSATLIRLPNILKNPIIKLTAAALIILAISFFMIHLGPGEKVVTSDVTTVTKSPAEMLTIKSLKTAYYNGGIEAVEAQCDNAIEKLGLKSKKITVQELLADINGV